MKIRIFLFIIILVLIAAVTTFIYQNTQQADINYYQGHRYFEKGEYNKAIPFFIKTLGANPDRLDALKEMSYSYQWTGKFKEAITGFQKFLKFRPLDYKVKTALAETYSWGKEYEKAISLFLEIADKTNDIHAREKLAEVYLWYSKPQKAKETAENILKDNPKDFKAKITLARAMQYSGEAEKAVKVYEELLKEEKKSPELKPQEEEIKQLLGESYMITKNYEDAIKQYMEILQKDPTNVKARVALADILSWNKKYTESISEYKKALELEPDNMEIKTKLAKVYSWNKDYKEAEELYKDIIEKNPENLDAYASLGQILTWDKKYKEAIRYFDIALLKKEDAGVKLLYGRALLYSGDFKRAREVLEDITKKEPENIEAKTSLADSFAYDKKFKEAIKLYKEILKSKEDPEIKKKLADVLSWDKQYTQAIDLYDEVLKENYDVNIQLQKARVLGWAREYDKSLREYQAILNKQYDELVELEMNAKKTYWGNRVKKAVFYYNKLIEKDPGNVEAMFDLSQIYSYQSMWADAIGEYDNILNISPNHFRAKEGLQKVDIISSRLSLKTGCEYLNAESQERDTDINRNSIFGILRFPLNYNLTADLAGRLTKRSFKDFSDVFEKEGAIKLTYVKNPCWWASGFYDFIVYDKDIDTMHTFGGNLNFRTFDMGIAGFSYERERLENSSTVIRENYYSDNFKARLALDITKRFKLGFDYLYALYSDKNIKNEPGFDILYYFSLEPKAFIVKYRYFYRDFKETVSEYFSPQSFWTNTITLNWRHFLNKEEIFFGADDFYYDLKYDCSVDSENVVGHKFSGEINWDINKRLNFNINGSYTHSSNSIYEEKTIMAVLKYYF